MGAIELDRLRLRPAKYEDAQRLFEWFNAPDSLAQKIETRAAIDWDRHIQWLEERLADSGGILAIIELHDKPIGQVRFQPKVDGHHVDIYIQPDRRRNGLAMAALRQALTQFRARPVVALVRAENEASHRLFLRLGFVATAANADMTVYELRH